MPLTLANLSSKFFQLFPKPLLTQDQLRLLRYDNIVSGKYKTNSDIGIPSKLFLKQKSKSTLICGERVDSFQQRNIILGN